MTFRTRPSPVSGDRRSFGITCFLTPLAAHISRSEAFPEYKANRTSTPDDFRPQVSLIREVLDALRIRVLAVEGYGVRAQAQVDFGDQVMWIVLRHAPIEKL